MIALDTGTTNDVPLNEHYKVDVNRGCHIRVHKATGASVYMFVDVPGVFYDDHGKPVPPEFAQAAGFDLEPLMKARRKHEALKAANAAIELQYKENVVRDVIAEHGEYRVVGLGNDLFMIEFEDGTPMSKPVNEAIAMSTFYMLTGTEPKAEEPKVSAKK